MSGENGKNDKSSKIMIGVIAALAVVIIALVVIIVTQGGKKNKEKEDKTASASASEMTDNTGEADEQESDTGTEEEKADADEKADCYVTITNSNSWEANGGYAGQLDAKITNQSGRELKNWSIEIDVTDGTTVDSYWNGNFDVKDAVLTITPVEYNGTIPASGSVSDIGFIVNVPDQSALKDMTQGARLYIDGELYVSSGGGGADQNQGKDEEQNQNQNQNQSQEAAKPAVPESGTPFDNHGRLSVKGTDIVDKNGDKYQLKGLSTHGLSWFPDYVNKDAFQTFRDDWGANLIRLAMYTYENGGYCSDGNKEYLKGLVDDGVQAATELGMYVIVDWHVLQDQNPNTYKEEAKAYFEEMSSKYKNYDNVIYEICNEPNGGVSWAEVKAYAEEVIPIIRKNAPDAIIIVGTPTWSQDVDIAAQNPITGYDNIMYAIHFYAATHTDNIRSKARTALSGGLPIFVSEFSICDASGNGAIDYGQAEQWFDLIGEYNLSYAAWNISNKDETSSLIKSSCTKTSGWTVDDLSETGVWIRKKIRGEG